MEDKNSNAVELVLLPNMNVLMDKDGIIRITYLAGSIIDVQDKMQEKDVVWKLTGGVKHPVIYTSESMVTVTKEAKEYSIEVELEQPFLAIAMLVDNFAYQLLADFYYKFYKPKTTYKVFNEEARAVEWLLEIKKHSLQGVTK